MSEIRCVANPRALVGEGPVWDDRRQVLWWIDVKNPRLFRYDPASGENREFSMPERIGCVALRANGGLIGAFMTGFKWIDPDTGEVTPIVDPEPERPGNRFNDGKCDRRGRLFAGTMDNAEVECTGTLYRLDPDLSVHVMCTDVHLSNGLGWSPDDRVLYYTDSLRRTIWAYDYDLDTGAIANRRVFARVPDAAGVPDGLPFAIHHYNLAHSGIHQIQNANLGALAKDKVWLSCTMILPLRAQGASGSPVRPVSIGAPSR